MKVDASLLMLYLYDNPFSISKRFLMKKGEEDVFTYGETPLTTLDQIAKEVSITTSDKVFELGCGRGRTCFWLSEFLGCCAVGIEHIPDFVERGDKLIKEWKLTKVQFRQEDMLKTNLEGATVIYLYGTCYEKNFIQSLIRKFQTLPKGTKIITISYPLSDFTSSGRFKVLKHFPAQFTWGAADVYYQIID